MDPGIFGRGGDPGPPDRKKALTTFCKSSTYFTVGSNDYIKGNFDFPKFQGGGGGATFSRFGGGGSNFSYALVIFLWIRACAVSYPFRYKSRISLCPGISRSINQKG